jgi:phosphoribosylformimino-5-aminoimidazole carboxamide ribotide isomerase
MKLYAAVDLLNKAVVQLMGGVPTNVLYRSEDVLGTAKKWMDQGAGGFHIVDLDGALTGDRKNKDIVKEVIDLGLPCQVGGGIRSISAIKEVVDMGARAIVGTMALNDEFMKKAVIEVGGENLIVALDCKKDEIVVKGWVEKSGINLFEKAKDLEKMGLAGILYTNVDLEGRLKGINVEPIEKLVKTVSSPVIVSGGISTVEDCKKLKEIGVDGCVLGSAIYLNKLKIGDLSFSQKG